MKTLFWIASILALLVVSGCDLREVVPAEMVSDTQSRPLGNETGLTAAVGFDIGSLEVAADKSKKLYSLDMEYDKASFQPEVQYETVGGNEGRLSVKLEGTRKFGLRSERRTNRIRLNLADSLPVQLEVRAGVGEARLSLPTIPIRKSVTVFACGAESAAWTLWD
jgi:hypothetical protein